ncbi:MAG TPA: alpha-L-fucosidase [Microthrixaceae bacterium]|nr:alpha-L-fucosidase [Microthrixaceae bacterium]
MDAELSRRKRRVPAWWADAKLGIFIHWVPASVPGFAPTDVEIGDLLTAREPAPLSRIPYSEWYENSLRFPDSPVSAFHRDTYGNRPYAEFADDFVAGLGSWDPDDWARRFAATGARYVVLVTKHHDGWCLWPSAVSNPHRPGWFSERDLVGELATAVRAAGMRFGVYYSGGYDWTFDATPIGSVAAGLEAIPGGDYPGYADRQVRELIDRYQPSLLWNDIAWPAPRAPLEELFSYYFDRVPDGVVNDRWMPTTGVIRAAGHPRLRPLVDGVMRRSAQKSGGLVPPTPPFFQYRTPEFTTFEEIQTTPWECVRGMDHGFGYNRTSTEADHLGHDDLLQSLVDIAATGGNLLLNVGPRGEDATIPDAQLRRLDWMAEFSTTTAAALQGTRPWVRPRATTPEGVEVRFTAHGDRVWALCWSPSGTMPGSITLPVRSTPTTSVTALDGAMLAAEPAATGLLVATPASDLPIVAIALDHVVAT